MSSYLAPRSARLKLLALVLVVFGLCGSTLRCEAASPTLSLTSGSSVTVTQGTSATAAFSIGSTGSFQGNVTLATSGLSSGVTASWSQNNFPLTSGTGASTLTLTAKSTASVTTTTFTVTASGDGVSVSQTYSLVVLQAPGVQLSASHQSLSMWSLSTDTVVLTAKPVGGVSVPSSAAGSTPSVSGLPAGITGSWSAPTLNSSGSVSWTLTLTGSFYAAASSGSFSLNAQITDANSGNVYSSSMAMPLTVSFNAPTMTYSPVLTHIPIKQGDQATDLFSFTGGGSFNGTIVLTIAGMPSFVSYSWSGGAPNSPGAVTLSADSGSSALTLAPSPTATPGYYTFTVTAAVTNAAIPSENMTVVKSYTVEVEPSAGMQVQLSNSAATIYPQSSATLVVTANPINGIVVPASAAGASAAVISALPTGITASMGSPTLTATGAAAWTLTLTADGTAQIGNSSPVGLAVQITDANSGLVYSAATSFNLLTGLLATVSVGPAPISTIAPNFLGFSHEWNDAQSQIGSTLTGTNWIYRQLLSNLTAYGQPGTVVPMNLRIGGDSTDHTKEPTSTTLTSFVELADYMDVQFELGINLGSDNVGLAVDQATDYVTQMPAGSVLALEIGNEPDLYSANGLRSATYDFQDYQGDFNTWAQSVLPVSQGIELAATIGGVFVSPPTPELANVDTFLGDVSGTLCPLISNTCTASSVLALFNQHYYTNNPLNNPPPDFLLTPGAATSGPIWVAPSVQAVHADGILYRMAEMGSISNGGQQGVSNNFASALWAVDNMFNYASVGVDGVNLQSSNGNYNEPFYFTKVTSKKGINTYTLNPLNPIYYGMLFFQAAVAGGAQLYPVSLVTPANLTAWAVIPGSGNPNLAIINKDETQSGNVSVTMPGYNNATIVTLTANPQTCVEAPWNGITLSPAQPYACSNGITFAGQTMDGSLDGTLQGSYSAETIQGSGGVFQIPMGITSAALVTFSY